MPTNNHCTYRGCKNSSRNNKNVMFHRITCTEWIERMDNQALQRFTPAALKEYRICSAHFQESDYYMSGPRKRLKKSAMPIAFTHTVVNAALTPVYYATAPKNESSALEEAQQDHVENATASINTDLKQQLAEMAAKLEKHIAENEQQRLNDTEKIRRSLYEERVKTKLLERHTARARMVRSKRKISSIEDVMTRAAHFLNNEQLSLLKMQLRHSRKCQWNEQEKNFALQIYSRGASVYRFLERKKKMVLPSETVIREWMNEAVVAPGFNTVVFAKLREIVEKMEDFKRDCVLMWHEISIRELLEYDSRLDCVTGFEDLGEYGRSNKIGNHVVVFMIRGLRSSWNQPIAYFISHGTVLSSILKCMIDEALHRVHDCMLRVRYMVCDQAQTNDSAIRALMTNITQKETGTCIAVTSSNDERNNANTDANLEENTPYYLFENSKIYFGFDVPHLLKELQKNLAANDYLLMQERELLVEEDRNFNDSDSSATPISWEAIKELRELEKSSVGRAATKL